MEFRDGGEKDRGGKQTSRHPLRPSIVAESCSPFERSPCFSSATDDERDGRTAVEENSKRGRKKKQQRFIYRGEEKQRLPGRRFRILDHRHGDQSPGNRVHNGSGSPGNSVVSVGGGRVLGGDSGQPGRQVDR